MNLAQAAGLWVCIVAVLIIACMLFAAAGEAWGFWTERGRMIARRKNEKTWSSHRER